MSQPPHVSVIPTYRQLMLLKIQESPFILSFDPIGFKLRQFRWYVPLTCILCCHDMRGRPVEEGERVPPAGWREYRREHDFFGPGCLCPLLQPSTEELVFTEAVTHFKMSGVYFAEYVAECAKGCCSYLGKRSLST